MAKLRILVEILLFIIVFGLSVAFALANESLVSVDFLIGSGEFNLGVALLVVFGCGALFGFIVRLPSSLAVRARLSKAERQVKKLNQSNDSSLA